MRNRMAQGGGAGHFAIALPLLRILPAETTPQPEGQTVPDSLSDLFDELALANRILAHEGVLDAFGHVSVRHPKRPRPLSPGALARAAPGRVRRHPRIHPRFRAGEAAGRAAVTERVIHGCIYQARSDVMAVCHHHAPAVLPFCIAGKPIVPVFHLGATIGEATPFWDQHDEFGDTNLLVANTRRADRSPARSAAMRWC